MGGIQGPLTSWLPLSFFFSKMSGLFGEAGLIREKSLRMKAKTTRDSRHIDRTRDLSGAKCREQFSWDQGHAASHGLGAGPREGAVLWLHAQQGSRAQESVAPCCLDRLRGTMEGQGEAFREHYPASTTALAIPHGLCAPRHPPVLYSHPRSNWDAPPPWIVSQPNCHPVWRFPGRNAIISPCCYILLQVTLQVWFISGSFPVTQLHRMQNYDNNACLQIMNKGVWISHSRDVIQMQSIITTKIHD